MQTDKSVGVSAEVDEALYVLWIEEATHGLLMAIPHLKAMQNRWSGPTRGMLEADMAMFDAISRLFPECEKISK